MSFNTIETSNYSASPAELFTFTRGAEVWRYTDSDADISIGGYLYLSLQISRSAIEHTVEMSRNPINITVIKDCPMLEPFKSAPTSDVTLVSIHKIHNGLSEMLVTWLGRMTNVKFGETEASLSCEPTYTSLKRAALRRRYQTGCPHVLYSQQCGANRAAYQVIAISAGIAGLALTSGTFGGFPNGYFAGGYIEITLGNIQHRRAITSHTGATITLNLPLPVGAGNSTLMAYPGCDHSLSTCNTKFANEVNFGGQPFYRTQNPMNGTPIF